MLINLIDHPSQFLKVIINECLSYNIYTDVQNSV